MEEDNFNPDCDDIKKNIKSFTEDMLKEEEYRAFLDHLETCSACKKYVQSVDSFSNQLWKLGDVKVPSDFSSTVLFQLTQPDEESDEGETSTTSKKWLIGVVAFILVGIILAAGLIGYLKLRQSPEEEVQIVQTPEIPSETVEEPISDRSSDVEFDQFGGVAAVLDETSEGIAFEWGDTSQGAAATEPEVDLGPELIHWHFLHYNKTKELEALRLRRQKRKIESDLRKLNKEKEQLDAESEIAKQKDSVINELQEKLLKVKAQLDENIGDRKRRADEPLNILQSSGIRPNYQDNDFVLFGTTGDGLKHVLDEMTLVAQESSSLSDFTPDASYLPQRNYQVSVYTIKKETSALHWHVHLSMANQKSQLLKTIQENGGVVTYEFAEEVTVSISSSKVEKIKAKLPAMRISISEYDNAAVQESEEFGETVFISIYFTK